LCLIVTLLISRIYIAVYTFEIRTDALVIEPAVKLRVGPTQHASLGTGAALNIPEYISAVAAHEYLGLVIPDPKFTYDTLCRFVEKVAVIPDPIINKSTLHGPTSPSGKITFKSEKEKPLNAGKPENR